eukprot:scaffold80787_cov22-Tisochrysis_lutea.AAC.1
MQARAALLASERTQQTRLLGSPPPSPIALSSPSHLPRAEKNQGRDGVSLRDQVSLAISPFARLAGVRVAGSSGGGPVAEGQVVSSEEGEEALGETSGRSRHRRTPAKQHLWQLLTKGGGGGGSRDRMLWPYELLPLAPTRPPAAPAYKAPASAEASSAAAAATAAAAAAGASQPMTQSPPASVTVYQAPPPPPHCSQMAQSPPASVTLCQAPLPPPPHCFQTLKLPPATITERQAPASAHTPPSPLHWDQNHHSSNTVGLWPTQSAPFASHFNPAPALRAAGASAPLTAPKIAPMLMQPQGSGPEFCPHSAMLTPADSYGGSPTPSPFWIPSCASNSHA